MIKSNRVVKLRMLKYMPVLQRSLSKGLAQSRHSVNIGWKNDLLGDFQNAIAFNQVINFPFKIRNGSLLCLMQKCPLLVSP